MSYLAKVKYVSLNTKRLDMLGYRSTFGSKFGGEVYLTPSGIIIVDEQVGSCFVPSHCIEMAVLEDGWREEMDVAPTQHVKTPAKRGRPRKVISEQGQQEPHG